MESIRLAASEPSHKLVRLVMTSATAAPAAEALLKAKVAVELGYERRKFSLAHYELTGGRQALLCQAASLWNRGFTSLLFLPGEKEIEEACAALGDSACRLHAKLEIDEIAEAMTPKPWPRIICATSFAEKGVTIWPGPAGHVAICPGRW